MDWSKSKSIFIVVFLILNIFLYTQYVDVYTQSQKVEVLSKKTTEAMLKEDNITYITLQDTVEKVSYLSGNKRNFKENEVPLSNSIEIKVVEESELVHELINIEGVCSASILTHDGEITA